MFDNINVFGDAFIHLVLVPYLGDIDDRDLQPLRRRTSPTRAADAVATHVADAVATKAADALATHVADAVATKAADAVSPDHGLWHEMTGAPFLAKILKAMVSSHATVSYYAHGPKPDELVLSKRQIVDALDYLPKEKGSNDKDRVLRVSDRYVAEIKYDSSFVTNSLNDFQRETPKEGNSIAIYFDSNGQFRPYLKELYDKRSDNGTLGSEDKDKSNVSEDTQADGPSSFKTILDSCEFDYSRYTKRPQCKLHRYVSECPCKHSVGREN